MSRWIAGVMLLAAAACDRRSSETDTEREARISAAKPESAVEADNTKKNERDRDSMTLLPGDQGESQADRSITQEVRQNVVGNDKLSMSAKNIKIITRNNVVTLRGPVRTSEERAEIARIAQGTTGVREVDNQLELMAP